MALKTYKPTTPSQRQLVLVDATAQTLKLFGHRAMAKRAIDRQR